MKEVELARVATLQRWIILLALAGLFCGASNSACVIVGVATGIFVYRLAQCLALWGPASIAVAACIPFVGLFVLLYLNQVAIRTLRKEGLLVGFLGVPRDQIRLLEKTS